jgi:hypothetical protein
MVVSITGTNAPEAYTEALNAMRIHGTAEESRNGPVLTIQAPVYLTIEWPDQRVIADPLRNANPFFHVMEAIWMFAGSNDVRWLEQFNKRYRNYADRNSDIIHGAYGHRWRKHFGRDQIQRVAELLERDPTTRRAVLGMWDPTGDLDDHPDLPCNTHILFRSTNTGLDMTVVNRSNDLIWGMLGANVVHMTMLQELICAASGSGLGSYHVITTNLHMYPDLLDNYDKILATADPPYDVYDDERVRPIMMLQENETLHDFLHDCEQFVEKGASAGLKCQWFHAVALPMYFAWQYRKSNPPSATRYACVIEAPDWRKACLEWLARKTLLSSTLTEP